MNSNHQLIQENDEINATYSHWLEQTDVLAAEAAPSGPQDPAVHAPVQEQVSRHFSNFILKWKLTRHFVDLDDLRIVCLVVFCANCILHTLTCVEVRSSTIIFASLVRPWASRDTTLYRTFFRAVFFISFWCWSNNNIVILNNNNRIV